MNRNNNNKINIHFFLERGIIAVRGMNFSRINAINWLKNQRTPSFGWGKNTHRAITALYLSKAMTFQDDDLEEELIAKQLELQISLALLRYVLMKCYSIYYALVKYFLNSFIFYLGPASSFSLLKVYAFILAFSDV